MSLTNISKWTVIIGTLLIWTVKFFVRPFIHIPTFYKPFIGLAPNLIGSFLLPFGACWLFPRIFGMQSVKEVQIASWFGLILVVINEYLQLIPFFGRTFDYLDILSSFIGVFFGYIVYAKLMARRQLKTYP